MDAKEHHKYFSFCLQIGIKIYPKVVSPGKLKIAVNRKGVEKVGSQVYYEKVTKVKKETKVTVPGLYEDIAELLREYYKKYSKQIIQSNN